MPYRQRSLQVPRGISLPSFRVIAAIVGALVAWAFLWFCTSGGNTPGGF